MLDPLTLVIHIKTSLFLSFLVLYVVSFVSFVLLLLFSVLFVSRLKTGEIVIVAVCDVQNDDLLLLADPAQHNESKKK